jgi:hypothetical protein
MEAQLSLRALSFYRSIDHPLRQAIIHFIRIRRKCVACSNLPVEGTHIDLAASHTAHQSFAIEIDLLLTS